MLLEKLKRLPFSELERLIQIISLSRELHINQNWAWEHDLQENADFSHVSRRNAIYMENVTDSFLTSSHTVIKAVERNGWCQEWYFSFFILIYIKMYLTMYQKCNFIDNIIINIVSFRQQARWNVHAFYVIP